VGIDTVLVDVCQSHLCVPTLDGNAHVIPVSLIKKIIDGDAPVTVLDDWEMIVRSVLSEWLPIVENAIPEYPWGSRHTMSVR